MCRFPMIGQTVSHYKILERLGGGGMGVVYKAEDTRLKRTIALKFLPPELTRDPDAKERFIHEAQAASSLQHNNICTVHDIDETSDGQLFIVMDSYKGETLKKKLEHGPVPLNSAIDIGLQVARGLQAAHEAGVVHRDVKPANIMVTTKGEAKILDFGLAKLAGQAILTKTGSTVGTAAYVSPEQARGEDVDRRSDIFSLGVVLYEMITGHRPFKGEHEAAIMYSLMNETPEPLARYKADLPNELQQVIDKSLAKDKENRYQHIDEMLVDLRTIRHETPAATQVRRKAGKLSLRIGAVIALVALAVLGYVFLLPKTVTPSDKSVAVLPFLSMSTSEDDRIFTEGIHEEILTRLAKLRNVRVLSRTSVLQYRDTKKRMKDIASELGVSFLVEGSARMADGRIRLTAQLIDGSTESHVWAETYEQPYASIFEIQTAVAENIARSIKGTLDKSEQSAITRRPTESLQAYEYYVRGNYFYSNFTTRKGNEQAVEMYQKAVELDTAFAEAYSMLAIAHAAIYNDVTWEPTQERRDKAKAALDRALRLAPENPFTRRAAANFHMYVTRDFDRALLEFQAALNAQHTNADILCDMGDLYHDRWRCGEALTYYQKSYELSPRSVITAYRIAVTYRHLRDWVQADRWISSAISEAPDDPSYYGQKLQIQQRGFGNLVEASSVINEARRLCKSDRPILIIAEWTNLLFSRDFQRALAVLESDSSRRYHFEKGFTYHLLGQKALSGQHYREALKGLLKRAADVPADSYNLARLGCVYAALGQLKEALAAAQEVQKSRAFDTPWGNNPAIETASIYILTGDHDQALTQLERLMSRPSYLTNTSLRLDPVYDPLRSNPRFQALLAKDERIPAQ